MFILRYIDPFDFSVTPDGDLLALDPFYDLV